jgi:hypothetical protein
MSLEARGQEYSPMAIRSFSVAGEYYESGVVDVEISPITIESLSSQSAPEYVKDTVFMQALVLGEKSLLLLKDKNAKANFYIIEERKYYPLLYKRYAIMTAVGKAIGENEGYKKTLAAYLKDCPGIQGKINTTKYDVGPMKSLFRHYYRCTNKSPRRETEHKTGKFEFGVVGGAALTSLKFSGGPGYLSDNNYETSLKPSLGFFLDLKILRSNNWSISNDVMYTSFDVKGTGNGNEESLTYTTTASFNFHYIKTHHMLHMNILKRGTLLMGAGFSTGFAIKTDDEIIVEFEGFDPRSRPFESTNTEVGGVGGIAFRSGRWSGEARYEYSSGISNYMSTSSRTQRVYFLLKYRLK